MKANQLQAAGSFAKQYGVKMLGYGAAGAGKTPLVNTAPRPVLMFCESGMLSMRGSTIPAWKAENMAQIDEFFDWVFRSNETKQFDTICIDSVSEMSEIFIKEELKRNRDGRKAYGEMARKMLEHLTGLYHLKNKHVYLIAKQAIVEEEGTQTKRPYFVGQELNIRVPHLYDLVAYIGKATIVGVPQPQVAIRTAATFGINARDRSGKLDELEPPHLGNLFAKAMS